LDGAVDYLNKKANSKKEQLKDKEAQLDELEEKLKKKELEMMEKEGEMRSQLNKKNNEIEELKEKIQYMSQVSDGSLREDKVIIKEDIIQDEYSSAEDKSYECQNINIVSEVGNGDKD
jgi:glutathionylspermidine synthase